MRAAPPLQIVIVRRGLWHAGVALAACCACAMTLSWWSLQSHGAPQWTGAAAVAALAAAFVCAFGLWRLPATALRWDRQRWWLTGADGAEQAGAVSVAIDFGSWMLLRFDRETVGGVWAGLRRTQWVALQRAGLEPQWHALRCAVYAARPAVRADAA